MLFLDEYATFHEIAVQCDFKIFADSTGAISAIEGIRDKIPSRHYPDHADIVSTLADASQIINKAVCQHVKSHQDDRKDFSELPFSAQVNVLCDRMATRHMEFTEAANGHHNRTTLRHAIFLWQSPTNANASLPTTFPDSEMRSRPMRIEITYNSDIDGTISYGVR